MKSKLSIIMALTLLLLTSCGNSNQNATQSAADSTEPNSNSTNTGETLTLKFAHVLAPTHPYQYGAEKFKEILEANAPSPVSVEIFHSSQLGSERDLTEGLQLGTVDIAIAPGSATLFEPKMGVISMPYLFKDREHARRVLDGEIGAELAADLPKNGLRLLSYWENGFRHITNSKRPIVTPEDLEGLKIRIPEDKIYETSFNAFGANATTMAFGELYTALSQKTVDGQENPLSIIATNKFYEAQEYLSLTSHFYGPAQVFISEITWNKLTPEMQQAIMDAAEQARDYERKMLEDAEEDYLDEIKAAGTKINEIDRAAFQEISKTVWEESSNEYGNLIERILE